MSDFFKGGGKLKDELAKSHSKMLGGSTERPPDNLVEMPKPQPSRKLKQTTINISTAHKDIIERVRKRILKRVRVAGADYRNTEGTVIRISLLLMDMAVSKLDLNTVDECETEQQVARLLYDQIRR